MAVSSAFVQLLPSIRGFHRDAAQEINRQRMTGDVALVPELTRSDVDKTVTEATKQAQGQISLFPELDRADVQREAETKASGVRAGVSLKPEIDAGATKAEAAKAAHGAKASITMTPDIDTGAAKVQADRAAESMQRTITMPIELDDVFAQKALLNLQKRALGRDIRIEVNIGVAKAMAGLTMINMGINRVTRGLFRMTAASTVAFGALAALSLASAGIGGLVSAIGTAAGALLIIPAAAGMGAAALGTLVLGFQGVGDTMSAIASGDAAKFQEALANLAPPARGLFVAIWDLREQFSALRMSVQGALFRDLAAPFTAMATNILPALQVGLTAIADAFNYVARQAMAFYAQASVAADLGILFAATGQVIRNLGAALAPVLQILQDVGTVGAQVLASMTAGAGAAAAGWAAFIRTARETGQLETWIRNAFTVLGDMVATLGNLGGIIVTVFSAASQSGAGLFAVLRGITGELLAMLRSAEGQAMLTTFFNTLRATVDAAMPGLRAVGGALVSIVQQIGPALPAVGAAFSALMVALKPVVDGLAGLIGFILPPLASLLQFIAPVIGMLAAGLAGMAPVVLALVAAYKVYNAVLAINRLLMMTNPIVLVIVAITALVGMIIYAYFNFAWFRDIVQAVWNALVVGAQWVWGVLVAAWNGIVAATQWLGAMLTGVFQWITMALTTVGGWFTWLWAAAIVPAWNGIVAAVSWAWYAVISPILNFIGMALAFLGAVIFTVLVAPFVIAWNLISAAVVWAWTAIIQPTFHAIAAVANWLWANALAPVFGWITAGWHAMTAGISWAWNNILRPAWDAVAAGARWLWNAVLAGIFAIIGMAWRGLLIGIDFAWNAILKPAWNAVAAAAGWLWNAVLLPIFGLIRTGWDMMVQAIRFVWESILLPTWNAVVNTIRMVWEGWLRPIFTAIGNAWRSTMDGIRHVYHTVVETTFNALRGAVHAVGQAFDTAVRWIGDVWQRIRGILARPVNFMIDAVYMGGVKKTWDMIAGWLGIPGLPPIGRIPEHKRGGIVGTGYAPGRDDTISWLGSGESVMRPEWTRVVGSGYINAANQAARQGGTRGVEEFLTTGVNDGPITRPRRKSTKAIGDGMRAPALAGGGQTWRQLWNIVRGQFPDISLTSSVRPGDPGYHGRGQAIDIGYGNYSRHGPVAAWIGGKFPNSTELISAQWRGGLGIKNGRPLNYGPATTAEHRDHVHWAMAGEPVPGGGGGGVFDVLGMVIDWFINTAMKPVSDTVGGFLDRFGDNPLIQGFTKIPGQAIDRGVDWLKGLGDRLWDIAVNALGSLFGGGGGGAGVEQWRGVALQALKMTGQPLSMVDILLRRMNQESGGNPNAINLWDSNAKKGTPSIGLMQTIQPTFDDHKMPGFNNIRAPLDNILASIRYALATYGSLPAAYNRAGGYDSGGWLPPGMSMTYNGTGRPEAILTADQWEDVNRLAERGSTTINVDAPTNASPERIAAAVDRRLAMSGRL